MKRMILLWLALAIIVSGCAAQTEPDVESAPQSSAVESSTEPEASAEESPAPEEEPLNHDWEVDTPENRGIDAETLAALHEAAAAVKEIRSIVVVRDGVLVDEYYAEDYDENSVFGFASCTKSFSGALIGIAIDQGLISGVDAKIAQYFPQIATSDDALKQEITIEHLLTHTSGLEWYEWNGGRSFGELRQAENWVDTVLGKRMVAEPGSFFSYTTGGSHLLSAILQEATGVTEYEFAREHMFDLMGMDSVEWRTDPQGITDGGNGISMNARDAAKFGQLYLNGGSWKGQQIIPEAWVEQSVSVQDAGPGGTGAYGYQWWLRQFGAGNYDTYFAMGHGGQYIFVVPELELVTVITSRFDDTYAPWPYFTDYVVAACK